MQLTCNGFFFLLVLLGFDPAIRGHPIGEESSPLRAIVRKLRLSRQACDDKTMCRSKWGYCGTKPEYCGEGCTAGPCTTGGSGNGNGDIINDQTFGCVFNSIDGGVRSSRLNALRQANWTPANKDEAAVFLAHVFHETDGLKTLREYCAPGCGSNYGASWCAIQGKQGKLYYGRGWFQLSWPCNYHAAGEALGVDLLNNPDLVEQDETLAVKTALWFYRTNGMEEPARRGDFAATTRKINEKVECNGGPGAEHQRQRVETYKRVRQCFGLGEPTLPPTC